MSDSLTIPSLDDLVTESDVEQKLIWPLLTSPIPLGLGYNATDIFTKLSIRRLEINKGKNRKLYYPDYIIVIAGLPVMIIEAKAIGEDIIKALDEARLYGFEINSLFPHNTNPCVRVVACNGNTICTAPIDSSTPDTTVNHSDITPASLRFADFQKVCCRKTLLLHVDKIRQILRKRDYKRPVSYVGGATFQGEELAQNTFGATIVGDYGHLFNPKTRADRSNIVRNAYIASLRRQRYIEPIDRLIRNAVAPTAANIKPIKDSASPTEITKALRKHRKLENQVMLLVGSVGAGKSTFVDYLSLVALPDEVRSKTVWLRLNLNEAPLAIDLAYDWTSKSIVEEFRAIYPHIDFDEYSNLEKIFGYELSVLKKGALAILDPSSNEFKTRISDRLLELQNDNLALAKGISKFVCSGPELLLVIVLDNCDKRNRDDQLKMFDIAQWIQSEFNCLVVLPIRDVTFDLYRQQPPLDTALKQFIFRIEPPQFSDVLQARVRLVLNEMSKTAEFESKLSYQLPNGIKVTYPSEDQAVYLASILRSLYAHDRFVRQVMTGIAGRDVRRALEIFLDFCMSGHIGEDEIYKIRFSEGQHELPLSVVARVLLRMNRRFYDGNKSYLKNIVQCDREDALPDHFVRITMLHWLHKRLNLKGPAGVTGFHRVSDMLSHLSALGHDSDRVRKELAYLARAGCVVPEHLQVEKLCDEDLIKLTASGAIHLQLMASPEYLSACAEDTFISHDALCKRIAGRISREATVHYSSSTTARNAIEFVTYLKDCFSEKLCAPQAFLENETDVVLNIIQEADAGIATAITTLPEQIYIGNLDFNVRQDELKNALEEHCVKIKSVNMPINRKTGKNKGYSFATPISKDFVLKALNLDGEMTLNGRKLLINLPYNNMNGSNRSEDNRKVSPQLTNRLYLGNLSYSANEVDIQGLLSTCDITAIDIYLIRDKSTRKSKGSCFIEVNTKDEAAKVIGALNGTKFMDRKLFVKPANKKREKRKYQR